MAEYGAVNVYDKKTGEYIGQARWRRPTDEISPEERRRRESNFNRQCYKFMDHVEQERAERAARGEPAPVNPLDNCYGESVEITPELIAEIDATLGPIKKC